jgi:hypothetical protein
MSDIGFAVGFDQTTVALFDTIIEDQPSLMPDEIAPSLGSTPQRTLDQHTHYNGTPRLDLRWEWLSRANFNTLIIALFGAWDVGSVELTLQTLNEAGNYGLYNVVAEKPQPKTHYQHFFGGDIRDLRIPIAIVETLTPPDGGLLLEDGTPLLTESGLFILMES